MKIIAWMLLPLLLVACGGQPSTPQPKATLPPSQINDHTMMTNREYVGVFLTQQASYIKGKDNCYHKVVTWTATPFNPMETWSGGDVRSENVNGENIWVQYDSGHKPQPTPTPTAPPSETASTRDAALLKLLDKHPELTQ